MSEQDRRAAAALAFAEAAWVYEQARVAFGSTGRPTMAERTRLENAACCLTAAEQAWFTIAADHQPATSDERRDAILARIAEALPRPDGAGLDDGASTGP